jgi:hypothetical protein
MTSKKEKPWKLCHISEFDFFFTPPLHPLPPYKSTPDFEVCDYTILPSSTGPCRLKKYAVLSVFKLESKPQSIRKEARRQADWKCLKEVPPIKAINVQCHVNIYCQQYIITE